MNYNFPKTTFAELIDKEGKYTFSSQIEHVLSEADEVAVEFKKWKRSPVGGRDADAMLDEVADLMHSCETLCRIMPEAMLRAMYRVTEKNRERGYYDVVEEIFGALKTKGIADGEPAEPKVWAEIQEVELPGGSTPSQYAIPEDAKDLQDLIEHREMNFADGNIFKATFRKGKCSHSDELRDARKVLWFAQREVERLEKA